jgi:bifunctional enzyme CysN/CysC/sulfate adenylyltransferase subunit 1
VRAIRYRVDIQSTEHRESAQLQMNDIAEVEFDTSLPLFFDAYSESREMGALILIDPVTNATVGAAMILAATQPLDAASTRMKTAAFFWLRGLPGEAAALRERLRERGRAAVIIDDPLILEGSLAGAVRALQLADVTAISARAELSESAIAAVKEAAGEAYFESLAEAATWLDKPSNPEEAR